MVITAQIPNAAASGGGGSGGGSSGSNNTTDSLNYPYAVPASYYPSPANITSAQPISGLDSIPLPGSSSSFALINASGPGPGNGSGSKLWFSVGSYSSIDAKLIAIDNTCGTGCGNLPINWTNHSEVAAFQGSVTAEKIATLGSMLVVAATSAGETYLYNWSVPLNRWLSFGMSIPGILVSLASEPEELAVATLESDSVSVTTFSTQGATIGQATVYPSGEASTGIIDAGIALTPLGAAYLETVAFSVSGSNQIQLASSTDYDQFSTPARIGSFSNSTLNPSLSEVGQTLLSNSGGIAGQLALVSLGAELFLLYTTNFSGQTVPATESSGNNGSTWNGPFVSPSTNGSMEDPSLAVGPAGIVYATWIDPDFGQGAVVEAAYLADGLPQVPPEILSSGGSHAYTPTSAPTVAVDSFERPLVLWPTTPPNATSAISYTGGFLPENASLNLTESIANSTLGAWDFSAGGNSQSHFSSLIANITEQVDAAESNLTSRNVCQAQNITADFLYPNLTHVPLSVPSGSGTVCAAHLTPSVTASPILPSSGIYSPDTYLSVYVDWALEAEGVPVSTSPLSSVAELSPYNSLALSTALPSPIEGSASADSETETVTVSPTPYSPTSYELAASDYLPSWSETEMSVSCDLPKSSPKISVTYTTSVDQTWSNESINNGSVHEFTGTTSYSSAWIDNLTPYQSYFWKSTFSARTSEVEQIHNPCTDSTTTEAVSPVSYGPASLPTITLTGSFATTLSISIGSQFVNAAFNGTHTGATVSVQFNNTLPSTIQSTLSGGSTVQEWNMTSLAVSESHTFPRWSPVNRQYSLSLASESRAGIALPPGSPSFSYGGPGTSSPEQSSAVCDFSLTTSVPTVWNASGGPYRSVNATTVNVTWNSSADVLGFFTYYEVGSSINWTITGITPVSAGGGTWVYSIELHGLQPLVGYNGTFGVSWNHGCLIEEDQIVTPPFQTSNDPGFDTMDPSLPAVWARDLPYDSINQVGGGVVFLWDTPSNSTLGAGNHTLVGGYIRIWNRSTALVLPFTPAQVNQNVAAGTTTFSTNPPLSLNHPYTYRVVANYTYLKNDGTKRNPRLVTSNESAARDSGFTYEIGTSGDGLTNAEKVLGWTIPLAPNPLAGRAGLPECSQSNITHNSTLKSACLTDPSSVVTANPQDYATNGLVNDFVEKEFDLNPATLDTATSHMLDTWNLTFNLGSSQLPSSTFFHYFYENSSYNFSKSCQVFQAPGTNCSFTPHAVGANNLTCYNLGVVCSSRHWVGDSIPWAAETLWSTKSLGELTSLMTNDSVSWLRAVEGKYGSVRTVTIWGKLSWGANPLVNSTSGDGVPDGSQSIPLGPVGLQFNITSWDAANPPGSGDGVAPVLQVESAPTQFAQVSFYSGLYGPSVPTEGFWGGGGWPAQWAGYYLVSVPITSTGQSIYWRFEVYANNSASGPPTAILNSSWQSVDLLRNASSQTSTLPLYNVSQEFGPLGSVQIEDSIFRINRTSNTMLLVPANNTTLSPAPWGLRRYAAEPDFDLLVLNDPSRSSPITVSGLASAGGGPGYSVTLDPGLNNILVPRGAFLQSPLGQALLNNTNESSVFDASAWSGRTETSGSNEPGSPGYIWVFSGGSYELANGSVSSNYGGIPGNPGIEAGVESRYVQSVLWANISSSSQLAGLVEGLVMNSSSNLSYNLEPVTSEVSSLGLPTAVLDVLANSSVQANGSYGPPGYIAPPSQTSPWSDFTQWIWNSGGGLAHGLIGGVSKLISVGWSAAIASAAYVTGFLQEIPNLVGQGLAWLGNQTAAALRWFANTALGWAVNQIENNLVILGVEALSPVWNAYDLLPSTHSALLSDAMNGGLSALVNGSLTPNSHTNSMVASAANNFSQAVNLDDPFAIGLTGAINVVSTDIAPVASVIDANSVVRRILSIIEYGVGGTAQADITIASERASILGWVDQSVVSSINGTLSIFGGGKTVPSALLPPADRSLMQNPSTSGGYMMPSSGFYPFDIGNFLEGIWHSIAPPWTYADFVLTFLAAEAYFYQLLVPIGALAGLLDVVAMSLTIAGFWLFDAPQVTWNYGLSIGTDLLSVLFDLMSYRNLAGTAASEFGDLAPEVLLIEKIADGIDMVADFFDVGLCMHALGGI